METAGTCAGNAVRNRFIDQVTMKSAAKLFRLFGITLVLWLTQSNCKTVNLSLNRPVQHVYSFNAESEGYNNIQSIYTPDSEKLKKPFFSAENLQSLSMNIRCDVKVTPYEKDTDGVLVCYEILNPVVSILNNGVPLGPPGLTGELSHPLFARLTGTGRIISVRTDTTITDMAAGLAKEIISRLQFVSSGNTDTAWQTTEENTTGTFTAGYRLLERKRDSILYEKRIGTYSKLKSIQKQQRVDIDSRTRYSTDSNGLVQRINASEAQVILFNNDTVSAVGSKVSAELKSTEKISGKELAELEKLNASVNYSFETTLSAPLSAERISRQAYLGTLGSDNWESLNDKLEKMPPGNKKDEDSLVLKFRALASLFPDECRKMGESLRSEPYGTDRFRVLSNALTITESFIATDEIAAILEKRREDANITNQLLPVLATTPFPTEKALQVVKEMAFDLNNDPAVMSTAQLALGGLANSFRKSDESKAEEITQFLMEKMKNETDSLQQVLVFGNTGSFSVFPFLKSYINNPGVSVQIRSESVSSLRLIRNPDIDIFLKKLLDDKDTNIVKAAKTVSVFRIENSFNK